MYLCFFRGGMRVRGLILLGSFVPSPRELWSLNEHLAPLFFLLRTIGMLSPCSFGPCSFCGCHRLFTCRSCSIASGCVESTQGYSCQCFSHSRSYCSYRSCAPCHPTSGGLSWRGFISHRRMLRFHCIISSHLTSFRINTLSESAIVVTRSR